MAGNFNLSNNSSFGFGKPQSSFLKKILPQPQYMQPKTEQAAKGNNPFDVDALFTFKKPEIVYDKVMKSTEMFNFLKAQKVAGQFLDLTKPEHEVGKRLDYEI